MSLRKRLAQLERTAGLSGPCSTCGGTGGSKIVVMEDPNDRSQPPACPECGKTAPSIKRIVVQPVAELAKEQRFSHLSMVD